MASHHKTCSAQTSKNAFLKTFENSNELQSSFFKKTF